MSELGVKRKLKMQVMAAAYLADAIAKHGMKFTNWLWHTEFYSVRFELLADQALQLDDAGDYLPKGPREAMDKIIDYIVKRYKLDWERSEDKEDVGIGFLMLALDPNPGVESHVCNRDGISLRCDLENEEYTFAVAFGTRRKT